MSSPFTVASKVSKRQMVLANRGIYAGLASAGLPD